MGVSNNSSVPLYLFFNVCVWPLMSLWLDFVLVGLVLSLLKLDSQIFQGRVTKRALVSQIFDSTLLVSRYGSSFYKASPLF